MPNTPSGGREHEHFTTESTIVVRKSRNMTVPNLSYAKFDFDPISIAKTLMAMTISG